MRILFTGGSGKAGRHVCCYLRDQGHRVVNIDLTPLDEPGIDNITADITDSGSMFNVMTSYAYFDELEPGTGVPTPGAMSGSRKSTSKLTWRMAFSDSAAASAMRVRTATPCSSSARMS